MFQPTLHFGDWCHHHLEDFLWPLPFACNHFHDCRIGGQGCKAKAAAHPPSDGICRNWRVATNFFGKDDFHLLLLCLTEGLRRVNFGDGSS